MLAFGMIGFVSGTLAQHGILSKRKTPLVIFGGLITVIIYGGIMNPSSVLMWQPHPTPEMIISSHAMGIPFDILHAAATVFFLWFVSEPMIEKLERVKTKYGLIEKQ